MEIELPDGTILDAPDNADPSVVAKNYLARRGTQPTPTGPQHAADIAGIVTRNPMTSFLGLGENALASITGGVGSLADAVMGSAPGAHDFAYRPRTPAGQDIARLGAEETDKAGAQYDRLFGTGPLAQTIKERGQEAMGAVGTVTGLAGLRAVAGAGKVPFNGGIRPSPGVRAPVAGEPGLSAAETTATPRRVARLAPVSEESPPKAQLKKAAGQIYEEARKSGTEISSNRFQKLQDATTADLKQQGLNDTLHPRATAALKELNAETGPVSLNKLETLRRIAQDAEKTLDPSDLHMSSEIVDAIDEFAENLKAEDFSHVSGPAQVEALQRARNYWSRARKADTLDELARRADLRAQQFSGSGFENALRTEFRQLAMNQRRMRLFTREEQAAIARVAKGGRLENSLRLLGKFAPTNLVSTVGSIGGGAAVGGPLGAVALPAAGLIGRLGATRMTMNNVARANALVRRGPLIVDAPAARLLLPSAQETP